MIRICTYALAFFLLFSILAQAQTTSVRVQGDRFIDSQGRQLLLHGLNAGEKHGDYMGWQGLEDYQAMRRWGMNCVRLLVIWAGLEPEPGQYDEEFLKGLDQHIAWAKEAGLYVMLDMHQDLYGEGQGYGGDGAPYWAFLDGGVQHYRVPGASWGVAYVTSPKVQYAFDRFWANAPAADGVGLQDHYAKAWQILAERYADEPTVIGYDLMNEPFPGTRIGGVVMSVLKVLPEILSHAKEDSDPHHRLIQALDHPAAYELFLKAIAPINQRFEEGHLADFHRRVATAIREVEKEKIIFITHSILCNFGLPSHVPAIVYEDGRREAQQAHAPHTYDLVTDTPLSDHPNPFRVEMMVKRAAEHAQKLGMPMLNGEWGAFYQSPGAVNAARLVVAQLEKHLCSETYWDYRPGLEQAAFFEMLRRPYPELTAGRLDSYRLDPESGVFTCRWTEEGHETAPTQIYTAAPWFSSEHRIQLSPEGGAYTKQAIKGAEACWISIPPSGLAQTRELRITPAKSVAN